MVRAGLVAEVQALHALAVADEATSLLHRRAAEEDAAADTTADSTAAGSVGAEADASTATAASVITAAAASDASTATDTVTDTAAAADAGSTAGVADTGAADATDAGTAVAADASAPSGPRAPVNICHGVLQSIGYKEFLPLMEFNRRTASAPQPEAERARVLAQCVERLKIATRQYARVQLTWLRNRFVGNGVPVTFLDSTNPAEWEARVLQPALRVTRRLLAATDGEEVPAEEGRDARDVVASGHTLSEAERRRRGKRKRASSNGDSAAGSVGGAVAAAAADGSGDGAAGSAS